MNAYSLTTATAWPHVSGWFRIVKDGTVPTTADSGTTGTFSIIWNEPTTGRVLPVRTKSALDAMHDRDARAVEGEGVMSYSGVIERLENGWWRVIQQHTRQLDAERALRALKIHFPDRQYRLSDHGVEQERVRVDVG